MNLNRRGLAAVYSYVYLYWGSWLALSRVADFQELEFLITESLLSNCRLRGAYLIELFRLSDVLSRVTYMYGIIAAVSSGYSVLVFMNWGGYLDAQQKDKPPFIFKK